MNLTKFTQAAILLFCLLFSTNNIFSFIVSARFFEKTLDNGMKQKIYLFGEWPINANAEFEICAQFHRACQEKEQNEIMHYAQQWKALVLAQDFYDDDTNETIWYRIATMLPKWLFLYSLIDYSDYTWASAWTNLTKKCREKNIKIINIECRHNLLALTRSLIALNNAVLLAYFCWTTLCHYKKTSFAIATAFSACSIGSLYGIIYQYQKLKRNADQSEFAEQINGHFEYSLPVYRYNTNLKHFGSWVEVAILTKIVQNSSEKIIFVCTEDPYCYNIASSLECLGYKQKKESFNPQVLSSYRAAPWLSIGIAEFIESTMQQNEPSEQIAPAPNS